jgi:hypothetical protein
MTVVTFLLTAPCLDMGVFRQGSLSLCNCTLCQNSTRHPLTNRHLLSSIGARRRALRAWQRHSLHLDAHNDTTGESTDEDYTARRERLHHLQATAETKTDTFYDEATGQMQRLASTNTN